MVNYKFKNSRIKKFFSNRLKKKHLKKIVLILTISGTILVLTPIITKKYKSFVIIKTLKNIIIKSNPILLYGSKPEIIIQEKIHINIFLRLAIA